MVAGRWVGVEGVMAVSGKNDLNFKVIDEAYTGPGYIFNSNFLDGLKCPDESITDTIKYLEKKFIIKKFLNLKPYYIKYRFKF